MTDGPLVVTVEDDDVIHVHPHPRPLLADLVDVLAQEPSVGTEFARAVDAAIALTHHDQSEDYQQFWTEHLNEYLDTLAGSQQLRDALVVVLTSGPDGTARALSDSLDDAEGTILGQQLRAQGVDDEPDREAHLADLGERPALTGGAS